ADMQVARATRLPPKTKKGMAEWPSGLKRHVQVAVRKGVGSNPTVVSLTLRYLTRNEAALKSVRSNTGKVAEWLRRLAAKPLGFSRVSSRLTLVGVPTLVSLLQILIFEICRSPTLLNREKFTRSTCLGDRLVLWRRAHKTPKQISPASTTIFTG